ncbi:uncharacterized protein TrAtP1_000557 [Trichoderma atroviride]|uniref:uncharacterized protein n=1 Tax=Hypocrea atroviridis TaxID=63577 RepID=UPI00331BB44E|nr:hypothetical protein TrAtP1_000557 [Trichoderma atroviride]
MACFNIRYREANYDVRAIVPIADSFFVHGRRMSQQCPVIAMVNKEAQKIAKEHGRMIQMQESTNLDSIWVQPRKDVLHLNWTRMRYVACYGDPDAFRSPLAMFVWQAEELGMQPSVVAEILHPFSIKALLGGSSASESPSVDYVSVENNDLADTADCASHADRTDQHLNITMAAVSLHITRNAVLRSGLFGLLGDAPVQMVDFDDDNRLGQFHELFKQNAMDEEPEVPILFDTFQTFQFRTAVEMWTRQAEWMIFACMWQRAQQPIYTKGSETSIYIDEIGTKPSLAWLPELLEKVSIDMDEHSPNMDHPWVKKAFRIAPRLRPQIMVRYCTKKCYIKDKHLE